MVMERRRKSHSPTRPRANLFFEELGSRRESEGVEVGWQEALSGEMSHAGVGWLGEPTEVAGVVYDPGDIEVELEEADEEV